jgi:2-octaprenyl-6-methoxyphenol hydroxylase
MTQKKIDFVVSGSGFVSLILCLILKKNQKNFLVFDKSSKEFILKDDKKSFALSKFTMNLLVELEVWDEEIQECSSPIQNIYIYDDDSKNQNTDFCIFESQDEPMGFMLDSFVLKKKLIEKIGSENIFWSHSYIDFKILDDAGNQNLIYLQDQISHEKFEILCDFFFVSEGKNSKFYQYFNIKAFEFDYQQTAFLFKINHSKKHNYSALEKFFEDGMIATLPLKNQNQSSIVWIVQNQNLELLDGLSEDCLLELLSKKIDYNLGDIQMIENFSQKNQSEIARYPLSLKFLSKISYKNIFFIGDSAHSIHPVAGQGLNLAVSDLTRILKSLDIEIGQSQKDDLFTNSFLSKFSNYIFQKKFAFNFYSMFFNLQMIGFTHFLNKIFLNSNPFLRFFRNKTIALFGKSKFLNKFLKKNATGIK